MRSQERDGTAVRVRLFAAARDTAGTSEVMVEAGPLAAVLADLEVRFGPRFAAVLEVATVLVDGSLADRREAAIVRPGSEIAVLPPFSGG
jgi:sulfur-carrier protein